MGYNPCVMKNAEIKFQVYSAEEGGFWAEAEDLGIVTQGDDLDELRDMIADAIEGYFFDSPPARRESVRGMQCFLWRNGGIVAEER